MCVNNMTTDYQLELYSIRFEREHFIKLNSIQMLSAFSNDRRRRWRTRQATGESINFGLCSAERVSDWANEFSEYWAPNATHYTHIHRTETEQMRMKKKRKRNWQCEWLAWKFYKHNSSESVRNYHADRWKIQFIYCSIFFGRNSRLSNSWIHFFVIQNKIAFRVVSF